MKKAAVQKFEASTFVSNLLLAIGVMAAAVPILLGDQLVLVASSAVTQGAVVLQDVSFSLQRLLS